MNSHGSIVVGVDRSRSAQSAVRWAAADAARHGAELLLVNVLSTPDMYMPGLSYAPINFQPLERDGRDLLREATVVAMKSAAPLGNIEISTRMVHGPVSPTLLNLSKGARLVVVGSRGMGAVGRGAFGSTSGTLARHAHCPVAVVHAETEDLEATPRGRVVVGVDGSNCSVSAIAIAFDEASTRGAELVAVHAWADPNKRFEYRIEWTDVEQSEHAVLAESLAGWAESYPDVRVKRVLVADGAIRALTAESSNADVVVVGTHGRGGFAAMTLGSTSQALLHRAKCPIIIARSPIATDDAAAR